MQAMGPLARATAGLLSVVLITAVGYAGTRIAMGALDDPFTFTVALGEIGQGLVSGSDVKVRGVVVGEVGEVTLDEDLEAVAEVNLRPGYQIPERSTFTVTNKTLLGEKQIEVTFDGSLEEGPYVAQGDVIDDPDQVVEFENVLGTLATLIEAIDEDDLVTVVDDFFGAFDGQGAAIARSVEEGARAADVFSRSLDDQEANNRNLSLVAEELSDEGDTFNRLGRSVNEGLPTLSRNQAEIRRLLGDLSRFSTQLDSTFSVNRPDIDRMIIEGDNVTRLLARYDVELGQVLSGLVDYTEKFSTGFQHPAVTGQAARFQILLTEEALFSQLCVLPEPLRSEIPDCADAPEPPEGGGGGPGGLPIPDPPDLPGLPDGIPDPPLTLSRELVDPQAPTRLEIDAMMQRALGVDERG